MRIILAGGGTAGHTSPLIATAQALTRAAPDSQILCIGTTKGLETEVIPAAGLELKLVDPVPLPRSVSLDLAKLPIRLAKSVRQARQILKDFKTDVVVGFGGYVSLPAYFAARLLKIPVVVHEQNALPGVANKVAARFAKLVATSFPTTVLPNSTFVGLPLKQEITDLAAAGRKNRQGEAREKLGICPDKKTLLVSGGSQGAKTLNDATTSALDALLADDIQVVHVWGPKNFSEDMAQISDPQTSASYFPVKYIQQMHIAYAAADLMLGRCGAGTVVETAAVGLPAIFVPYPFGNGEQVRNAEAVVQAGAAKLIEDGELTPDRLLREVTELFSDEDKLDQMGAKGQMLMPADAATKFAEKILALREDS